MYEDPYAFASELAAVMGMQPDDRLTLEYWRLIEVRYPELLADWLTEHAGYEPPPEQGIRIGKRADHFRGGRRNLA